MIFSQSNEQEVILDYFKNQSEGTFLDIGANDGQTLSNTRALALNGWNGACIEPGETAFNKLSLLYADSNKVDCYEYAITVFDGAFNIYESGSINSNDTGLLSSLILGETLKWQHQTTFEEKLIAGRSWKTFCDSHASGPFDFISIDAEGMDLEILFQIDLKESGCKLLCIEWGQDDAKKNAIQHYVSKFGMKLISINNTNVIYGL